jgi:SNF2 family DNA or RNA helicase
MASFVNPGLLGPLPVFKRVFQQPIAAGRDRGATPAEARLAEQRSGELARQLSLFVLRRTSDVNHAYLPPKTEALVFLRLAPLQAALYRAIAASRDAQRCVTGGGAGGAGRSGSGGGGSGGDAAVLRTLNALRKVCMHPDLLLPKAPGQGKGGMAGGRGRKGAAAFPASQLTLAAGAVGQKRKRVAVGGAYAAAAAAGAAGRAPKRKPAAAAGTAASLLLASSDEEGEEEAAPEGSDGGDADAYGEGSEEDEDDDGVLDVVADEEDEDEELDGASDVSAGSRPRASAGGGGGLVPGDPSEDPLADCLRLLPAGYTRLSAIPLLAGGAGATAPASGAAAAAAAGYGGLLGARGAAAFLGASSPQQQPPPLSAFELALSHSSKLQFVDRLLRHVRGGRSSSSGGSIAGLDANAGAGGGSAGSGSSGAGFCGSASGTSSGAGASVSSSGASGSAGSEDKVVLVSNYTQVLDLCAALCAHRGWPSVRLDGSTPAAARSDIVAAFNRPGSAAFVFLLSSQAGGVGLNLVSANRLVLLDSAWNPALDRQALARVWRDGQRKHTYIYRLFAAHSMEEKILQRQLLKEGVASALGQGGGSGGDGGAGGGEGVGAGGAGGKGGKGGGEGSSVTFSRAELRELFTMNPDTPAAVAPCDTYRVMRASYSHAAAAAAAASAARAKVPAAGTSGGGRASGDRAVSDDDGDGDSEPDAEAEGSSCGGSRGGSAGGSAGESSDSSGGAAWWAPWRGAASVAEDVALYASLAVPARRADATEALHTSSAALSSAALGNADEGAGVVSGSGGGELATYVKLYRVNHKTVPPAAASSGRVAGSTGAAEATASSSVTGGVARPAAGGGYRSALQQLEEWECELQLEEGDGEGAAALPAGGACSGVRANATRCGVAVDDDEGAEGVAED